MSTPDKKKVDTRGGISRTGRTRRHLIDDLPIRSLKEVFERHSVALAPQATIEETRLMVMDICDREDDRLNHNNSRLRDHMEDVGNIAKRLLEDEAFKASFLAVIDAHFPDRRAEADRLFEPATLQQVVLGLQFHDIGKLHTRINTLINEERKLTGEELDFTDRHSASIEFLDALGISEEDYPIVREIVLEHHTTDDETLPLAVLLSKLTDIFHAFVGYRGYRKRDILFYRSAKEQIEDGFVPAKHEDDRELKDCYSIEDEMRAKCKTEDPEGRIITLFLETMERYWQEDKLQLAAKTAEQEGFNIIHTKTLQGGYGKLAA